MNFFWWKWHVFPHTIPFKIWRRTSGNGNCALITYAYYICLTAGWEFLRLWILRVAAVIYYGLISSWRKNLNARKTFFAVTWWKFKDVSRIWNSRNPRKVKLITVMEQVHDLSEALPSQAPLIYHVEVLQDPCRWVAIYSTLTRNLFSGVLTICYLELQLLLDDL